MTKKTPPVVREAVSLYAAKTHLSSLIERVADGEEIVITKSGRPKARLVPLDDLRPMRQPGRGRGQWHVADDFDAPLPEGLLSAFEGEGDEVAKEDGDGGAEAGGDTEGAAE